MVVSTSLKNMKVGIMIPNRWKNQHVPNHQQDICCSYIIDSSPMGLYVMDYHVIYFGHFWTIYPSDHLHDLIMTHQPKIGSLWESFPLLSPSFAVRSQREVVLIHPIIFHIALFREQQTPARGIPRSPTHEKSFR